MKRLHYEVYGLTDIGLVKDVNEDGYVYKTANVGDYEIGIFAVADGVGGLEEGQTASSIAISNVNKWWETELKTHYMDQEYLVNSLIYSLQCSNKEIGQYARGKGIRMATTLSVLLLYNDSAIIVHVGDSRVYRFHRSMMNSELVQLTMDHTCLIDRVINNQIVKSAVLTESLGGKEECKHYSTILPVRQGDVFIVCSDGIYKTIKQKELQKILKNNQYDLKELPRVLIEQAKSNRETDNISVIAVSVND